MTLEIQTLSADDFAPLSFDAAVALTDEIRLSVADLELKIVTAYYGRAWKVMEYGSWDDYVQGEFKKAPLAMPREDRPSTVASLRSQGLSLRAIAAATGVSKSQAAEDLNELSTSGQLPERITGLDGKSRPASRPEVERTQDEIDREEAMLRDRQRLHDLIRGWVTLSVLWDLPYRASLLDSLTDFDRERVLEIEAIYRKAS